MVKEYIAYIARWWPPKPEVLIYSLVKQIETKLQRLHLGFQCCPFQRTCRRPTMADIDRRRNFKMAAAIPEVIVTFVLYQIETTFQRLHRGFRCRLIQWTCSRHRPTSTDIETARWRPPNRKSLLLLFYNK